MTIIVSEIVEHKWKKTAGSLCDTNITFLMSWTSVFTCQVAMISNLVTIYCFFKNLTNSSISIMFFVFLSHINVFLSVFKIGSFLDLILQLIAQTSLHYYNLEEIYNIYFVKFHSIQILDIILYIPDFVYEY